VRFFIPDPPFVFLKGKFGCVEIEFAITSVFRSFFHLLYQAVLIFEEKANRLCEEMRISFSAYWNPQKELICLSKLLSTLISHKATFPAQTRDASEEEQVCEIFRRLQLCPTILDNCSRRRTTIKKPLCLVKYF